MCGGWAGEMGWCMNMDGKILHIYINHNFVSISFGNIGKIRTVLAVSVTANNLSHRYFHILSAWMQIYPNFPCNFSLLL